MSTLDSTQRPRDMDNQQPEVVQVAGGRQLAYAEYGDPDGVPVVFLHGTPGSRRLGALLETDARQSGIRVLAPDRPGYGRSSPWPDRSVGDAAEFLTPVLDDAGVQSAGLVGFSGGGAFALSAAATAPERITGVDVVSGATPPSCRAEAPAVQRLLARLATTAPFVLRGLFRGQTWLAKRLGPSLVVGQYTEDVGSVADPVAETVKEDFLAAFARQRSGAVTEFRTTATDWGVEFGAIDAEVRLWHGENDRNVPVSGARCLGEVIPSADLRVLEDADHLQTLVRAIPDVLEGYH